MVDSDETGVHMYLRWLIVLAVAAIAAPVALAAEKVQPDNRALRRTPVVEVFEKNRGAVVNISATMEVENYQSLFPDSIFNEFFDGIMTRPGKRKYSSIGSGFIIHSEGYVVTNAHVVMRAVDQRVIFADGTEFEADRVALDEVHDLAILKIHSEKAFHAVTLGRSDDLMIGETVVAIGNPLEYQHTVTSGIVSALNRTLTFDEKVEYKGLIQTDASINRGNSGGPLLNILGELIGITTAIRGDAQNIGFAIPVDQLHSLLPEMLSIRHRKRLEVGLKLDWHQGVRVSEATGPAAQAGVKVGDELVSLAGKPIHQDADYYIYLLKIQAGDKLDFVLKRSSKQVQATVKPASIPIPDAAKLLRERTGLSVRPLTRQQAEKIHPQLRAGLLITNVEYGSPAHKAGFTDGYIIVQIGKYVPSDLDEVAVLLESLRPGERVVFRVLEVQRREILLLQGELTVR
jgi:serine protease Do